MNGPGSVSWTETPGSANAIFSIVVTAVSSASYPAGTTVLSTTLTAAQAGCITSDRCSYPIAIGFPGTYSVTVTDNNTKGGVSSRVSFTIVTATQPSIVITATSGSASSQSALSIKVGDTLTISGTPQNLSSGFTRAFFFDPIFNGSCTNNSASDSVWTLLCTARQAGTGNFYVEIYQNS